MEFSTQFFKAPKIDKKPKLGKKMVSSSVFRGVKKITPLNITPTSDISNTLVETNNILSEIQNQLALDFAHRISREEDTLKKIRSQSQKDKRDREEKSVEGVKKVGSVIGGQVKKIAAPAISLLDRIKNFFLSLVTGFVINQAMKWLAKPGNAERIGKVFNFIGKNWKVILSLIGGVLISRAIYKIYRAYRLLRKGLGLLGIGRRGAGAGAGDAVRRGGLIRNAAGGRRGFTRVKTGRLQQMKDQFGRNVGLTEVYETKKNPLAKGMQRADVGLKRLGRGMMGAMKMGPGAKGLARLLRPIFKRIPVFGALIDFAVSLALGEPIGRAAAKAVGAGLGGALGSFIPIPGVGTILGGIVGDMIGGAVYDMLTGGGDKETEPEGFNLGGRIGGKSGIDKNTVRVSKGEYVTREPEAKKLGYGFMDYQNEGGFFRDMKKIVTTQESANKIFTDSLLSLKETTDRLVQIQNKKKLDELLNTKNTKGSNISSSNNKKPPVSGGRTGPVRSLALNKKTSSTIVMPPVNMAPITKGSPSPTQAAPPSGGNSIPVVNSIDIDNFLPFHVAAEFGII